MIFLSCYNVTNHYLINKTNQFLIGDTWMMGRVKYKEIIDYAKTNIATGEWPIGSKLPSQRELAKRFAVNRSTVITALEELAADGLIEAKMGMGTIVVNNTWTLMQQKSVVNWNENIDLGSHQASMAMVQSINQEESNSQLIQLSKGELSKAIFPIDKMKEILHKVGNELSSMGYEEPKGNLKLRQAISDYLLKKGISTSPSSILIVSGALQALQLISIGLLQKGSIVFLEKPSYLYSLSTFQAAGMQLSGISMDDEGILPNEFMIKKGKHRKAILYTIPSFHNPTGISMSVKRRKELLLMAYQQQLPIIEDDVYGDLWLDEPPPPPLKAEDKNGNVLYIGSLSKSLSPGLRIGWIIGPETVIERLADLKMQTDYGSSSISQQVASEWLSNGAYEYYLKNVREQLRVKREFTLRILKDHIGDMGKWNIPKGGYFIWLKVNTHLSLRSIYAKALAKGILLNPGSIYSQQTPPFIRISYAYASVEEIKKGIIILSEILKGEE
jgi:GntR family transcriptional regulator, regulator for abcA and norABC